MSLRHPVAIGLFIKDIGVYIEETQLSTKHINKEYTRVDQLVAEDINRDRLYLSMLMEIDYVYLY